MKIKMDKQFVEDYQIERVKADMKEFKARYTDGDLMRAFEDATDELLGNAILTCDVTAFDSGSACGNYTEFYVNMIVDGWVEIQRVSFYCDMMLEVDTRTLDHKGMKMYTVTRYAQKGL